MLARDYEERRRERHQRPDRTPPLPGGSLADLDLVRGAVDVPVLRKDFILSSYQLWEARAHGADLVLLVAHFSRTPWFPSSSGRTPSDSRRWSSAIPRDEVARAVDAGARDHRDQRSRDLRTLELDRTAFAQLAPDIPDPIVRVAESGFVARMTSSPTPTPARTRCSSGRAWSPGATRGAVADLVTAGAHPAPAARSRRPAVTAPSAVSVQPDAGGHFGPYGGRFVPEALVDALDELTHAFLAARADPAFGSELGRLQSSYTGRPSPLTEARRFAAEAAGHARPCCSSARTSTTPARTRSTTCSARRC